MITDCMLNCHSGGHDQVMASISERGEWNTHPTWSLRCNTWRMFTGQVYSICMFRWQVYGMKYVHTINVGQSVVASFSVASVKITLEGHQATNMPPFSPATAGKPSLIFHGQCKKAAFISVVLWDMVPDSRRRKKQQTTMYIFRHFSCQQHKRNMFVSLFILLLGHIVCNAWLLYDHIINQLCSGTCLKKCERQSVTCACCPYI